MFDPESESQDRDERAALQLSRLRQLVGRLRASGSDYWSDKLAGAEPDDLTSLDDLRSLPFTGKAEFRDTYPLGMLAVPREDVVRVHASSGTSGKPTIVAYTANDVAVFAALNARALACAGASSADTIHVAYGYGLFTGGLGLHFGVEALGAMAVPASGGNQPLQLSLLADLGARGLCATPSFSLLLAERAIAEGTTGIDLRYGVLGAEPWSEPLRERIEASWSEVTGGPFDACDIYGLSEVMGPGVAAEAHDSKGAMFLFDDHVYPEIVEPGSGVPVRDGERGELVLTTLTREAQPVIRYRTGDVTRFVDGETPCGRTHRRIARLQGRVDDMLIVRGVNVFPREIETVLLDEPGLTGAYRIVVDRRETLVRVEVVAETGADGEDRAALADRLRDLLRERVRVGVDVTLVDPGTLPVQETGKAQRVFTWDAGDARPW
ncbi:MAG: phenylacetate--CoA ligase [Actinobacteria bacterium]|nr:phenylacetate--CoA ligase [Actinomycetota bacterium]